MLRLSEWNNSLQIAKEAASHIADEFGVDLRVKTYTMYDDSKGIQMQLFDSEGHHYRSWYSGIPDSYSDMVKSIGRMGNEILYYL